MKTQAIKNRLVGSCLALFLAVAFCSPVLISRAAEPADGKKPMMEGNMKEQCEKMKDAKEKMRAEMKVQDADLAAKVTAMNAAPDDQKQILMAGLITRLVEQRTAMHEKTAKMEEMMMQHMMEHMEMGKKSMSGCPMMKEMKDHSTDAGKEHQAEPK